MLSALIDFSLRQPLSGADRGRTDGRWAGVYNAVMIPIDAVPDMTNVQVQVVTEAGSLSPLEVERYVTYPVEATMGGLPNVEADSQHLEVRHVAGDDRVSRKGPTSIGPGSWSASGWRTRASGHSAGLRQPVDWARSTTALGEVLQFEVRSEGYTPMELRTHARMGNRPAAAASARRHRSQRARRLLQDLRSADSIPTGWPRYGVALDELFDALERNNASAGGGYVVHHGEQRFIRGQALLKNVDDIENVVVRTARRTACRCWCATWPRSTIAPLTRQGAVTRDGRGEAVTGMVMMLIGENSREWSSAPKRGWPRSKRRCRRA